MEERKFLRLFLLLPSVLVLYFVYQIFQPFLKAIFLAVILATMCYPGYKLVLQWVKGRTNVAAFLTCFGITAVIIVPFVLLLFSLVDQARQLIQQASEHQDEIRDLMDFQHQPWAAPVLQFVEEYVGEIDSARIISGGLAVAQQFGRAFVDNASRVLGVIGNLFVNFFIMLITMFFLFRDGADLVERFKSWTPLSESYEQLIIETFQSVAMATVLGSLATAVAQGFAGGLVFWLLGLPNALVWGSLMALFSLVPVVGTGLVWVPWTIYLLVIGSYGRAIVLATAAILFIGMIDNVLRPVLIEGKAKMHTLLVFFSILGGIAYFNIIGMILGPIIVALGLTFLELYKIEYQSELSRKDGEQAEIAPPPTDA